MPMYGLPLSQLDRRTLSVFQSVYNNGEYGVNEPYASQNRQKSHDQCILFPKYELVFRNRRALFAEVYNNCHYHTSSNFLLHITIEFGGEII